MRMIVNTSGLRKDIEPESGQKYGERDIPHWFAQILEARKRLEHRNGDFVIPATTELISESLVT